MTVTIFENGFRARLACGTVAFAMALGTGVVAAPAAQAAQGDGEPPVLHVSAGSNGVVAPGLPTTASVTVENTADQALPSGRVTVSINRTPLAGEEAVSSWLDSDDASGDFDVIAEDSTEQVDAGASVTTSLAIPEEVLATLAPGVYPVRAALSGTDATSGADVSTASVLVISADPHPPVTVFVPITATPADGAALLSSDELTELTAADGDLTAQLDGVSGTSAVLAIDPAIVAAIRVLGSSAPTTAVDWLARLENLPNERFALQFADADATTQAQADLPALLTPTTLTPFLDPANFSSAPPASAGPTPAGTPTPSPSGGPALPGDDALTAIDRAVEGILWPRADVTHEDLEAFRSYLGGTATTILPSTAVGGVVGGHANVGAEDVLVTDSAASDALSDAAGESDAEARAQSLSAANAFLYLAAQTTSATLAIGLDRDENRTSDALREAVTTVDSPGVNLTSLRAELSVDAAMDSEAEQDRGASLQLLLSDEQTLGQFSTILDDPQVLLSPERIRIMRTIGAGLGATRFDEALSDHRQATRETLDSVGIPPASTIQLLSANADLPFAVRNDLPWPVNVVLTVLPSDPRLEVESVTRATIPAGTTTRVKVPVSARVGSGELDLRLSLTSPTGVPLGQSQTVRVAVRAEWEGIGLAIFGSLIVILIVLGVVRTVHRRRKGADAETEASGEDDEATATDVVEQPASSPDASPSDPGSAAAADDAAATSTPTDVVDTKKDSQ